MTKHLIVLFTALISAGTAQSAHATGCVLHVWSTDDLGGATMGSSFSGALPALMSGSTDKQVSVLRQLLNPAKQIEQMKSLDFKVLLNLPADTEIVYHDVGAVTVDASTGLSSKPISGPGGRCEYNFKIEQILFNRHPLYGKDILTFFKFTENGGDGKQLSSTRDRVRTKMHGFPSKVESDQASVELVANMVADAFKKDVTIFSARIKIHH